MTQQPATMFAGQAIGLAEMFPFAVGKRLLEGPITYRAELSAPDGPSTAGGKQPLQHVTLVAVPEGSAATLLIGTVNVVEKHAELRTFQHVDGVHRQRFKGAPFAADLARYDALLETIRAFLVEQRYQVNLIATAPAPTPSGAHAPLSPPSRSNIAPAGPPSRPVAVPAIANLPSRALPLRLILTISVTAGAVVAAFALLLRG